MDEFEIEALALETAAPAMPEIRAFYGDRLGLGTGTGTGRGGALEVAVGAGKLRFEPADGEPFHHFALLVPGDRFDAAREWLGAATGLLTGERGPVFEFGAWSARAMYFADPAGNIAELISHRGLGESGREGRFAAAELLGISEAGLVVADPPGASRLLAGAGIPTWDGDPAAGIAFAGARGHTLVLSSAERNWMPTTLRATPFRVEATLGVRGRRIGVSCDRDGALAVTGPGG